MAEKVIYGVKNTETGEFLRTRAGKMTWSRKCDAGNAWNMDQARKYRSNRQLFSEQNVWQVVEVSLQEVGKPKGDIDRMIREAMKKIIEAGGDGEAEVTFTMANVPWKMSVEIDVEKLIQAGALYHE